MSISPVRGQLPRLSILVLSRLDAVDLERSMGVVSDAAYALGAQVVLVREEASGSERELIQRMVQQHKCSLAWVGAGSDRSAMTDEGLKLVTGDIVTCREDHQVHDGEWLAPFSRFHGLAPRRVELEIPMSHTDERSAVARVPERPSRTTRRRIEATPESVS